MQAEMFPDIRHDAGGKVKTKFPAGMFGDAVFKGDRDQYRPLLRRWVGQERCPDRYVCFIGMNPSTADSVGNDPTITREWGFTVREGFDAYVKCNVSDYRATKPNDLLVPGIELQGPTNGITVAGCTSDAALTIVCWGSVNKALKPHADRLLADLRFRGVKLWCFGTNADGVDCRQDLTRDCHREVTRLDDSFPRSGDGQVAGFSFRV